MEVNFHSLAVSRITYKPLQTHIEKTMNYCILKGEKSNNEIFLSGKNEKLLQTARVKNTKPPVIKNYLSFELLVGKFHFL